MMLLEGQPSSIINSVSKVSKMCFASKASLKIPFISSFLCIVWTLNITNSRPVQVSSLSGSYFCLVPHLLQTLMKC